MTMPGTDDRESQRPGGGSASASLRSSLTAEKGRGSLSLPSSHSCTLSPHSEKAAYTLYMHAICAGIH